MEIWKLNIFLIWPIKNGVPMCQKTIFLYFNQGFACYSFARTSGAWICIFVKQSYVFVWPVPNDLYWFSSFSYKEETKYYSLKFEWKAVINFSLNIWYLDMEKESMLLHDCITLCLWWAAFLKCRTIFYGTRMVRDTSTCWAKHGDSLGCSNCNCEVKFNWNEDPRKEESDTNCAKNCHEVWWEKRKRMTYYEWKYICKFWQGPEYRLTEGKLCISNLVMIFE